MAAPVLAIGDGALGFWAALRDVFPATREQRCWFHKIANVLNALPKSAQPGAKAALAEIWNAEDREHAEAAARSFVGEYGTKWPKAVAKITDDLDVLLEFYNYPAERWVQLRTTNPLESTFATVRLRQRVTKGPDRGRPAWRWRSSSSSPPSNGGVPSTRPPRRSRPGRSPVRERPPGRTSRRIRRRSASRRTRQSRRS
jgi:putative transposase